MEQTVKPFDLKKNYFKINIFLASRVYREKYTPIAKVNNPFFDNYSIIDDPYILQTIKKVCFTKKDVRAGWFGSGLPKTNLKQYQNFADWATEHLMMYQAFLPICKKKNPGRVLDIGSGLGYASLALAHYFKNSKVFALDYDEEAVFIAKKFNSHPRLNFLFQDFFNFSSEEKFDYIFALEVLEHIKAEEHDQFMKKCLKLLERNGLLFISTPNALDEADAAYGHLGLLNRKRAKSFLKKYHPLIYQGFFIDNKKLLSKDPRCFIVRKKIDDFENRSRNLSHFHLAIKNNRD